MMKSGFQFILLMLTVLPFSPIASAQQSRLETYFAPSGSELETISRQRFKDLVAKNTDSFAKLYADDFIAIGPDGKAADIRFLKGIAKVAPKDFSVEPFDYHVTMLGDGNQAIVYHKSHDTWDGQKSDTAYTEVYVRRSGRWMLQFENYSDLRAK